jgi:hypothetical protein
MTVVTAVATRVVKRSGEAKIRNLGLNLKMKGIWSISKTVIRSHVQHLQEQ